MLKNLSHASHLHRSFIIFVLLGYTKIVFDLFDGERLLSDVDDEMRFFQIRDLHFDRQWYDLQLPFIAMPEPYISPWSRLVDFPYIALSSLFATYLADDLALKLATWLVPPLLFLVFAWIALITIRDIVGRNPTLTEYVVMITVAGLSILEFSPGRIDHHNFQLLFCLALAKGVVEPRPMQASIWLGVSTVLSVAVGLELIPVIVTAFAIVGGLAATDNRLYRQKLQFTGAIIAIATPIAAILILGFQDSLAQHCDAFSRVWVDVLMGSAALALFAPTLWQRLVGEGNTLLATMARLLLASSLFALLITYLWLQYPACSTGVYHMIDDASRAIWLDNVVQEKSGIYGFALASTVVWGIPIAICFGLVGLVVTHVNQIERSQLVTVLSVCALAGVAVVLTLIQGRFIRFPLVLAILLVPTAFQQFGIAGSAGGFQFRARKVATAIVLTATAFLILLSTWIAESSERKFTAADYIARIGCIGEDFSVLEGIEPSLIMAPFGMAYKIVEIDHGHQVVALEFHRSSPGIRRLAHAFVYEDLQLRNEALAPVDYVVVCARDDAGDFEGASLYRNLTEGTPVAGFERVESPIATRVLIYEINHGKLANSR